LDATFASKKSNCLYVWHTLGVQLCNQLNTDLTHLNLLTCSTYPLVHWLRPPSIFCTLFWAQENVNFKFLSFFFVCELQSKFFIHIFLTFEYLSCVGICLWLRFWQPTILCYTTLQWKNDWLGVDFERFIILLLLRKVICCHYIYDYDIESKKME